MNGPVFDVIFVVGLAAALSCLSLIALGVFFSLANWWRSRGECRRIEQLRAAEDRKWAELDEHDDALCRTLDEIKQLPVADPWSVL